MKIGFPSASVRMPTKRRSATDDAVFRFHTMYHWLLGGALPEVEGWTCSVNHVWWIPGPRYGSDMVSVRMFTLPSAGVFCSKSLFPPSGKMSVTATTPLHE